MADTRSVEEVIWVIFYDDADKRPEFFTGEGAADAAHKRYQQMRGAWDCHLLGTQTAILAALKAEEMVVVPVEPTIEMLDAMPSLPAIKLPVPQELKHLTPSQYQNRVRYKGAIDRAMISAAKEK